MTLGDVQRRAGKPSDAEDSFRQALAICEAKGIRPRVERARSQLQELAGGDT